MEEIQTGSFGGDFFAHFKSRKLVLYIVGGIILVVAALTIALVVNNSSKTKVAVVCSTKSNLPLMNQASTAINKNDASSLQYISAKVSTFANYKNDPNCLYVMFQTAVQTANLTNAQKYLTDLKQIYPKYALIATFGNPTIQQMQSDINNARAAINSAASDTIYLSNPK